MIFSMRNPLCTHPGRFLLGCCIAACLVTAVIPTPPPAHACLWDHDTFKEEALGQREVALAVTGDIGKHGATFINAKVHYTRGLLALPTTRNRAERYDDLAVALARLGNYDEALAVLDEKESQFPDLYTTKANRGTFLMLKGELDAGATWLQNAMAQNPNAHFGREKYQLALLRFVQARAKRRPGEAPGPATFIDVQLTMTPGELPANHGELLRAITQRAKKRKLQAPSEPVLALVGLIRFGAADQMPDVWFALGWALLGQGDSQLAARAFRRAEVLGHPRAAADGALAVSVWYGNAGYAGELSPANLRQWQTFTKLFDAEWKNGQRAMAQSQAREERLVRAKQFAALFGY